MDMTKLIVAFLNFANSLKNIYMTRGPQAETCSKQHYKLYSKVECSLLLYRDRAASITINSTVSNFTENCHTARLFSETEIPCPLGLNAEDWIKAKFHAKTIGREILSEFKRSQMSPLLTDVWKERTTFTFKG